MSRLPVRMPQFDPVGSVGRVVGWLVGQGQRVRLGQTLVEVEGGKASLELAAQAAGLVESILVPDGGQARPHEVIGVLLLDEEDCP